MPHATVPASPPDPADVARDLRATFSRLRRRMREVAASDELSPSQTAVLTRLGKGEAATASALATLEDVRPQSMAATVAVLVERGMVTREPDPEDGRRQLLRLTPDGRAAFDGDVTARREWLAETLRARLDEAELRTLADAVEILGRVTE
jgi:DNA-binding MarR family transcriptional regulator